MSSIDKPASQKTYTEQATDTLNNVRDAISNSLSADGKATAEQPTVGSKLGDAWQSVKDATGIAAANTDEQLDKTKAQAEVKKDETKEQLDAARTHAHAKTAESADVTAAAVKDARSDLAARIEPKN